MLLPRRPQVKVRGVQVHGRAAPRRVAGQRTAINLGGVEVGDVSRGETLAAPGTLSVTRRVDAVIDLLPSAKPLKHGARVRVHNGTAEVLGRVSIAGAVGRREIAPGASALVRAAARGAGGADARRSLHHPRLLAADHDRRRRRARPGADAARRAIGRGRAGLERLRINDADEIAATLAMIDAAGLAGIDERGAGVARGRGARAGSRPSSRDSKRSGRRRRRRSAGRPIAIWRRRASACSRR